MADNKSPSPKKADDESAQQVKHEDSDIEHVQEAGLKVSALLKGENPSNKALQVLASSVRRDHPGFVPQSMISEDKEGTEEIVPCCFYCCGPLTPDNISTSIKKAPKLTRTQRRRLSRQTARMHREKQRQARHKKEKELTEKGMYILNHFKKPASSMEEAVEARRLFLYRMRRSKKHLSIRCECGATFRLPVTEQTQAKSKKLASKSASKQDTKALIPNQNLIKLPPSQPSNKRKGNLLLSSSQSKKKKKSKKKGELLDFLSSLNN